LLTDWNSLDRCQKGDALKPIREDFNLQQLAKVLRCSEKKIRDYEMFGHVPPSERCKLEGKGTKKIVAWQRKRNKTLRRWRTLAIGKSGRKLRDKLTRTLVNWFETNLNAPTWGPFLDQVLTVEPSRQNIRKYKPGWWEWAFEVDWEKTILETRPAGDPESFSSSIAPGLFDFEEEWLARWYPRCMPIGRIAEAVLVRTRKILRDKVKKMKYGEQWVSGWY
jgi:hypothetical protein